jgi:hypothetical protein
MPPRHRRPVATHHLGHSPPSQPPGGQPRTGAGPICMHGYSVEYPKYLTKKFIYIVYYMYMSKNRKNTLHIGLQITPIRPHPAPLASCRPRILSFSQPNPPAQPFGFGSNRTRTVSSTAQHPSWLAASPPTPIQHDSSTTPGAATQAALRSTGGRQ